MNSQPSDQQASSNANLIAYLYAGLFVVLGVSALVWFATSLSNNEAILSVLNAPPAEDGSSPSVIIAFLTEFGIVLPLLVLVLGATSVWLGVRLFSRNILAARWAQVALNWLVVASAVLIVYQVVQLAGLLFFSEGEEPAVIPDNMVPLLLGLIGAIIVFALLLVGLRRVIDQAFHGKEVLGSGEVRAAWNLLIPTLVVFVFVAARPLEQTFIRSLTDKRFAGQEVPNFVGIDNYTNLLGINFATVGCRIAEDGERCDVNPAGNIRWESIDREVLQAGYRTVYTIELPLVAPPRAIVISGLDQDFLRGIGTTLLFTVVSVSLELLIAFFMALTVNSDIFGQGLMRAVMLVPWAIPTVISARLWELMLKDSTAGIVNKVLMDIGLINAPQAWLSEVSLQLPAAIMVDVWKTAPFMALLLLAGLQTIPQSLYEAASVDGANQFQKLFRITLPLLRPTIAVALVFRTLDALRVFDLFNVLFGRQQLTMATYNYEALVNNQQDGYASAISIIIFILISVFAFMYVRLLNVETE